MKIVRWLQWVAFALWLGGLIGIGALSAPAAFDTIRHAPATAGLPAPEQSALAGQIVGTALRHFNVLCVVLVVLLCIGVLVGWRRSSPRRQIAEVVTVGALGISLAVLMQILLPAMDAAQAAGQMPRFDTLHRVYENVANLQMLLLLVLAALYVARDNPSKG